MVTPDDARDAAAPTPSGFPGPAFCGDPDQHQPETLVTVAVSQHPESNGGCTPDGLICRIDLDFTPTTPRVFAGYGTDFDGPLGNGGTGTVSLVLHQDFSVDLVGTPVRASTLKKSLLDCITPDTAIVPGEPMGVVANVLRDANGEILMATGQALLKPDGAVDLGQELLPELKLGWVSTPREDCLYRSEAFELTTMATGKKVLAPWQDRVQVTIGGHSYLFLAATELTPLVGVGCEPANWVLVRDGFLHPVPIPDAGPFPL